MFTLLPRELLSLLSKELGGDKASLNSLCQTSSAIYHLVVPILYEDVCIATNQSLVHFCLAINRATSHLGDYIRVVNLTKSRGSNIFLNQAEVHNFRTALMLMPNVRELRLEISFRTYDSSFNNINPPFTLQKLSVSPHGYDSFKYFLYYQPSITELKFFDGDRGNEAPASKFLATRPDILPNLNSVTGSLLMLRGVIPGRPVTSVTFNMKHWEAIGGDTAQESIWETIYRTSTVPITTTGFYHCRGEKDPWLLLIPALRKLKVHLHLKRFRIIEDFDYTVADATEYEPSVLTQRIKQLSTIGDFEQLEAVEVAQSVGRGLPEAQVLSWFGDMGTIADWKEHIPSLRQVTMYGIELE